MKNDMKGFVGVSIPTKKYIKAYVLFKLGSKPLMIREDNSIGNKMHDLMEKSANERRTQFKCKHYNETLTIYIPVAKFRKQWRNLNESNIKNFNLFIEAELKERFYFMMDDMIEVLPNFISNLPEVRRRLGIEIETWNDESMRKSFYRYRLKKKGKDNASYIKY